jgi:ABC-type multidrug transport system ATPase subunit
MNVWQGSSGAGKSTLMDVLALRKTGGKITGEVLVNGRKTGKNLSRIIGYVEQQDIHSPTQSIYEAIELSALVRCLRSILIYVFMCLCIYYCSR